VIWKDLTLRIFLGKIYEPYKAQVVRVFPYEKHLIYYSEESHGITVIHVTHKNMDQERHLSEEGI
jgi:plasmid stabilization system protein ParE